MLTVDKQIKEVVRLREDEELTFIDIAEKLDISERTARRRYEAGVLERTAQSFADLKLEKFPDSEPLIIKTKSDYLDERDSTIERFKPLTRTGDAVITSDFHIPLHDPALINTMIRAAKKFRVDKLVIAGDFWTMDEFSSYLPHQPEAAWDVEKVEGNTVMKTLLRHFNEVDFCWGNHDFRLSKSLGFKYSFTDCMKWTLSGLSTAEMSRIRFTDLDYMYYEPGDGRRYRVCHPQNYSDVPLTVGRKLAIKYNCSIISAHSHHFAIGGAANGKDLVIEAGGFFDKFKTEYIQRTNTNHEWVQGFTIFKHGRPHLIGPILGNDVLYRKGVK